MPLLKDALGRFTRMAAEAPIDRRPPSRRLSPGTTRCCRMIRADWSLRSARRWPSCTIGLAGFATKG